MTTSSTQNQSQDQTARNDQHVAYMRALTESVAEQYMRIFKCFEARKEAFDIDVDASLEELELQLGAILTLQLRSLPEELSDLLAAHLAVGFKQTELEGCSSLVMALQDDFVLAGNPEGADEFVRLLSEL